MELLTLFWVFFKIGLFTVGGGYAMIPLIQTETVACGWTTATEVVDFIAVSESTPGPFAVNMATFLGTKVGGVPGAICATVGVVLPSFLIILLIARFFKSFQNNRYVMGGMRGLRPAALGLLSAALISIALKNFFPAGADFSGFSAFFSHIDYISIGICIIIYLLHQKFKMHPILVVALSASFGLIFYWLLPMLIPGMAAWIV